MLSYRPYTHWRDLKDFYVYGYLREVDDEYGIAGTLYYVGKGRGNRVVDTHRVKIPSKKNIVIFNDALIEEQAFSNEESLIEHYGRIIVGTGILENKDPGGGYLTTTGMTVVLNEDKELEFISVDDPRFISGELQHMVAGTTPVVDKDGNRFRVATTDPRFIAGELVAMNKGMVTVKDACGDTFNVSVDDPRFISGELQHCSKGTVTVKDSNGNTLQVDKDDSRYLSGELIHATKGTVKVKGIDGKVFRTSNTDPRIASGELVGANTGMKYKKEQCPHCGVMAAGGGKKHHFDRCKKAVTLN